MCKVRRLDTLLLGEQAHDFVQARLIEHGGGIPLQSKNSSVRARWPLIRKQEGHGYCPKIGGKC
ncbi:Unknown protein sequence [Pseudomonas syringae pv. maculicola]|nr:Unknown protein sequence [Pseudomonas syringae pv. maculicola]